MTTFPSTIGGHKMKNYFINPEENRLSAGWRISIFFVVYIVFSRVLTKVAFNIIGRFDRTTWNWWVVRGFLVIIAGTIVVWLVRKFIDKKSFVSLGLRFNSLAVKDFFIGLGISGVMIGTLYGIFFISGFLVITKIGWSSSTSGVLGIIFWFFGIGLAIAWSEELAFRGYVLQNLKEGLGIKWAVIISCALYGLLHMSNPNSTILSGIIIAIIGYLRIYGWLRTQQLWLSMGMHAGWDFFLGPIFGFSVSGMKTETLIKHTTIGAEFFTGGSFGPEAGILVIPFILLGFIGIYFYTKSREF